MKSFVKLLITAAFLFLSTNLLQAQAPPHPNNGAAPSSGGGNTPVGAGAPVADGQFILLALGLAYAGRKWYEMSKKEVEDRV